MTKVRIGLFWLEIQGRRGAPFIGLWIRFRSCLWTWRYRQGLFWFFGR